MSNNLISMARIRALYAEKQPDGHWFDRRTLKFFGCRLPRYGYSHGERIYFVSSECDHYFDGARRCYTIRAINWADGEIDTIGEFQQYATASEAKAALRAILKA